MENILSLDNTNMHMILVAKIYYYDITITDKNDYSMHFGSILALKEASYMWNFFVIIIGKIKWFGFRAGSIL